MSSTRTFVVAIAILLVGGQATSAGDLSRYREYALGSSLESVVATSGARAADVRTVHTRPAVIQELSWRAQYVVPGTADADPVGAIVFAFYDDALFQVVVEYDRDRTQGLGDKDIVRSLTATYGPPAPGPSRGGVTPPAGAFRDGIVIARWEDATSVLMLVRAASAPEFQLILASKPVSARAREAAKQAVRLDALEAPRREAEQRKSDADEATAAQDKTRTTNKAAFRP